jgi:hypothetical protein
MIVCLGQTFERGLANDVAEVYGISQQLSIAEAYQSRLTDVVFAIFRFPKLID